MLREPSRGVAQLRSHVLFAGATCACAALLYRYPPGQNDFYPACPIYQLTGLLCPGCGITRALAALVHGDLASAFHSNPLALLLLAFGLLHVVYALSRGRSLQLPKPFLLVALVACAIFTLLRNLV